MISEEQQQISTTLDKQIATLKVLRKEKWTKFSDENITGEFLERFSAFSTNNM